MARLDGVSDDDAGLVTGQIFKASVKKFGTVAEPLRLMAHSKPVMYADIMFELAWDKAKNLDRVVRDLCQLKVAAMVGCVF
jgi:hypothetical protein